MDSLSYMRLNRDFGSFDEWQKDFIAAGKSSRCGWVVTYLNMYTQSYMNCIIDLHAQNVPAGMYPVIVMDMWQHAYYKDYLKDGTTYLSAMMKQLANPSLSPFSKWLGIAWVSQANDTSRPWFLINAEHNCLEIA